MAMEVSMWMTYEKVGDISADIGVSHGTEVQVGTVVWDGIGVSGGIEAQDGTLVLNGMRVLGGIWVCVGHNEAGHYHN